ncbi:MAG: hypothetical protein FJ209_13325, partial [Betaproteobacteria bacterium]|nr:hypothetical protein [Betaproteobacteria bacterium]
MKLILSLALTALLLAGCATDRSPPAWTLAGFDAAEWRGRPLAVECRAQDTALAAQCREQLAARLAREGAQVQAGATASLSVYLAQAQHMDSGPSITLGGWGGSSSGGSGGGVGISLPIGGAVSFQEVMQAQAQLLRAADGQAMWSYTARTGMHADPQVR